MVINSPKLEAHFEKQQLSDNTNVINLQEVFPKYRWDYKSRVEKLLKQLRATPEERLDDRVLLAIKKWEKAIMDLTIKQTNKTQNAVMQAANDLEELKVA